MASYSEFGVSRSYLRHGFLTGDDPKNIVRDPRKILRTVLASFMVLALIATTSIVASPSRFGVEAHAGSVSGESYGAISASPTLQNPAKPSVSGSVRLTPALTGPVWTNLTGPISPPRANYVGAAFDPIDHYLVTFGGQNASAYPTNETWVWQNGTWSNLTASAGPAPVARMGMALTYDPVYGYVVAYGGGDFFASCGTTRATACNSTWTFHGGRWQVLPTTGPSPPVSMQLGMVYDAADSYVVASDGFSTWKFSAGAWTELCGTTGNCSNPIPHPPRFAGAMAYDSQAGEVLYFGDASTWKFSGGNWTNITSTSGTPPPSGQYGMMTDDPAAASVLYFGGCGAGCNSARATYLNYTWSFSGGTWTNITALPSPPGRYAGALAYDSDASAALLFGGDTQLGAGGNLNDTWVWGTSPPIGELLPSVSPPSPLPGSTASFSVKFNGGVSPFSFSWRFGDGGSSSLESPTHIFAVGGFYRVSLWVNDSASHTASSSLTVHVYVPLSVDLTASPNPAVLGQPVNFTASITGGTSPWTVAWSFGDGGIGGNLTNITHVFTTNGPFTTELTVRDSVGGVTHGFLNISIRLQALAAASTSSGASPLTVSFVGQAQGGTPPYAFSWTFGDGATSTAQYPRHTYNSSGVFNVALTVTDSRQNRSSTSLAIQVGGGTGPSSSSVSWFYEFVGAAAVAGLVGGLWIAIFARQRMRRREADEWVNELTKDEEPRNGRTR